MSRPILSQNRTKRYEKNENLHRRISDTAELPGLILRAGIFTFSARRGEEDGFERNI